MITAADCLVPFDYSRLPAGVSVIAGYVGESANHIWTPAQISAVTASGRRWWAIYTPLAQTLDAAEGTLAGQTMADRLTGLAYPKLYPVFLDVERGVWDSNPAGAIAAITAWRAAMKAAGWTYAYPYAPVGSEPNWLPQWQSPAPNAIPPGAVGVQYAGLVDSGRYDLSLFQQSLWDAGTATPTEDLTIMDAATKAYIDAKFASARSDLSSGLKAIYNDQEPSSPHTAAMTYIMAGVQEARTEIAHLAATVTAIQAKVAVLPLAGVAPSAASVAAEIIKQLKP